MGSTNLEDVTREAVEKSQRILTETQAKADALISTMQRVTGGHGWTGADTPSGRFVLYVHERSTEIERLFENQAGVAKSFNIVLFGRTGAGKSTLIETLTRGTGSLVSHGESDWTTDLEPKTWNACKVYDTPGVNGWGTKNKRADLEERARRAVEVADFVLVCFDSQSQQASEFEKVAAWVKRFNKPVIAVLNARNPVWRFPLRVFVGAARANVSLAVAQHAGNIKDELAKVGLYQVPVVAIASKRALFARASLPFEGPDRETLEFYRSEYGVEKLEAWSNFRALEGLLVRCISEHGVTMRLAALHDQLRGVLDILSEDMARHTRETIEAASSVETQAVGPLLKVLGYPATAERRAAYHKDGADQLAELEQLAGRFQAPSSGEFEVYVEQRMAEELGALRSASLVEAEEAITYAFDQGAAISGEDVSRRCFDSEKMEAVAAKILKEAIEFINRCTRLAYRDSVADLKARIAETTDIEGDAGAGWKYGAWGMKGAGVLGGVVSVLGTVALTNGWNPIGWYAAGMLLIGSVASILFGWLGGKARKKAEAEKLGARLTALAAVRQNVHAVYDDFKDRVTQAAADIAAGAAAQLALPAIEQALILRRLAQSCANIAHAARVIMDEMPAKADPQILVWETKAACEREAFAGTKASALHWLGESWIDDPEGLLRQHQKSEHTRQAPFDPGLLDNLFGGARDIWLSVTSDVVPGAGRVWLSQVSKELAEDELAQPLRAELQAIADRNRPRLYLIGDYNAGKSSFIKRLLLDAGETVSPALQIRSNPTTDGVHQYAWGQVDLIDIPGFQSSNESHGEVARRTFPDASAILYLFQPNLVVGDDFGMQTVLLGDRARGIAPKVSRTFFIINRGDELGVDPAVARARYKELAERKRTELSQALTSRGINISPELILCMASDPYGLVGNRLDASSSSYDDHRNWDGFQQFMKAFRDVEGSLLRSGVDRSILEGGMARLARLADERAGEGKQLRAKAKVIRQMEELVLECKAEGHRLAAEHRARLEWLVDDHTSTLKEDILSEQDSVRLNLKAVKLGKWYKDPALTVELVQWNKQAYGALQGWSARTSEAINRRLDSAEFRAAFPDPNFSGSPDAPDDDQTTLLIKDVLGKAWKVGSWMGGATRNVVYDIGKSLCVKFKPWGAVKLAKNLGKAGAVLAVVGVVWDFADAFLDERRLGKREESRKAVAKWLSESATVVVQMIADGSEAEPGLMQSAAAAINRLDEYLVEIKTEADTLQAAIDALDARRMVYAALHGKAELALGGHIWEAT
jgi:GTPase Era involved in 16S rRNA processing